MAGYHSKRWNKNRCVARVLVWLQVKDADQYLTHGTNKQIYYKIFQSPEEIDERPIIQLLKEAIEVDQQWKSS